MKPGTALIAGIAGIVALAALGIAVAVSILHNGLSARATPSAMEAMLARNARRLAIPADARNTPNPVQTSDEVLHGAAMHFADHCSVCHANDGSGDTMFGKGLYPKVPDLREHETQKLSDGELFWIIENGVRFTGMPAFGGHHDSTDDSWKLVLFVRHLPQLTTQERLEMEKNNPTSPGDREEEQQENEFLDKPPGQHPAAHSHSH
jgi:mono/diheme cytochrome c family protein